MCPVKAAWLLPRVRRRVINGTGDGRAKDDAEFGTEMREGNLNWVVGSGSGSGDVYNYQLSLLIIYTE
jgi:hypothetical protein